MAEEDGKCDKWILHVNYQLPVTFSTFSVLVYIKNFLGKMSVNATDMAYPKSAPDHVTSSAISLLIFKCTCFLEFHNLFYQFVKPLTSEISQSFVCENTYTLTNRSNNLST